MPWTTGTPVTCDTGSLRLTPAGVGAGGGSGQVMNLLQAVDRRRDALVTCLELKGQVEGVVARLVQVPAVEPQRVLLGRLPHVALFALPGSGVFRGVRTEAPDLADLIGDPLADQ